MTSTVDTQSARITPEMVEQVRSQIAAPLRRAQPHIEVATRDAIRHWAHGSGDANPLWLDLAYAARTRWGGLLAPPTILYAMERMLAGTPRGFPGIHSLYGGIELEWSDVIRENDGVVGTTVLKSLEQKPSRYAGTSYHQTYETIFQRHDGAEIARARMLFIRFERGAGRREQKYAALEPHTYAPEEILAIEEECLAEEARGATPRYWEDVAVGEALPRIVRGPLTVTDCIAFEMGWGGVFVRAHRYSIEFRRAHPAASTPNEHGVPDVPERVHWDPVFARQIGAPAPFDFGPQRGAWMGTLVTNWMGDAGRLRALGIRITRMNLIGDTTWLKGRVVGKELRDGRALLDLELWAEDQRGQTTATGRATVELPRRAE